MFKNLIGIYTDPTKAFENIKMKTNIIIPLLIIVIVATVGPLVNLFDGTLETLIIDQIQASGQVLDASTIKLGKIMAVVTVIIGSFVVPFIAALVYHIMCMVNSKTGYKKTLSVIVYSNLILSLQTVIILTIYKVTGVNIIFSPHMFMSTESATSVLGSIIGHVNLFYIWYLFVLFIGFKVVHEMTKKEALITILVPLSIKIIFSVISTAVLVNLI